MLLPRILWTDVVFRSIFYLTSAYFQRTHPHALSHTLAHESFERMCFSIRTSFFDELIFSTRASSWLDVQLVWPWNYFSLWRWSWDIESPPLFVVFMFVNDVIIPHFALYAASLAAFHPWLWNLVFAYIGYYLIFVGAVLLETMEINGTSAFRWCYLTTFVAFVVSNRMYLPWLGAQKKLSVVRRLMEVRNR